MNNTCILLSGGFLSLLLCAYTGCITSATYEHTTDNNRITYNRAFPEPTTLESLPPSSPPSYFAAFSFFLMYLSPPTRTNKTGKWSQAGSQEVHYSRPSLHLSTQDNDDHRARRISSYPHIFYGLFYSVLGFRLVCGWEGRSQYRIERVK